MSKTVFTRLLEGELPCAKVYEDELTFAFMDAGQVNPGHVIVATKAPIETFLELDEDTAAALFRTAHKMARRVARVFKPDGMTLLQANKAAGWQTVPHVHVHVLPRYEGDGVGLTWPRMSPPFEDLLALAARLNAG